MSATDKAVELFRNSFIDAENKDGRTVVKLLDGLILKIQLFS